MTTLILAAGRCLGLRVVGPLLVFALALFWTDGQACVDTVATRVFEPVIALHTQSTLALLRYTGATVARAEGGLIQHPEFTYEIDLGCTNIRTLALMFIAIGCCGVPMRRKFIGLATGLPLLVAINIVRLVHLYGLRVHDPAGFNYAHDVVWPVLMMVTVLAFWFGWRRWAEPDGFRSAVQSPGACA